MNKKIVICIILIILTVFTFNTTNTYASTLGDVISGGKNFINSGSTGNAIVDENKMQDVSGSIYRILLVIAFVVVAVVGIILGMQYMMSGVEEKADVKNSLIVFAIGAAVSFGAFGIWRVVVTFLNTL